MPLADDAVEGGEQGLDLALAPVQLLGNQEPVGRVVLGRAGTSSIRRSRLPVGEAAPQIALDAGRGLVALLGGLGEQLHDDRRD